MKNSYVWVLFVILYAGVGFPSWAQTTQGEILGTVTDEAGAVIPGAQVTITSLETASKRTAMTNSQGFFNVPHLEPGEYQLEVEKDGFLRFVRERVRLDLRAQIRLDASLTVGQVSEQIVIDAGTPVIETESGRISDAVEYRTLRDVVMNGRGVHNWIQQAAGTFSGNGGLQINGSRGQTNGFTLDGAPVEKGYDGNGYASLRPDQEMIREIRIESVNNSAEFGRMATVQQTSMNGTNDFHGQASYIHQNGALNAKNFFATTRPRGLPIHAWYFSGGGPVRIPKVYDGRNRTFFFVHHDGTNNNTDAPLIFNTPTLAMRQGNFAGLQVITDPATGQPFTNNQIPANRLNLTSLRLMERFFALPQGPNSGAVVPASNFAGSNPTFRTERAWSLRVDQNLGPGHSLFVRYWQSVFDVKSGDLGLPEAVRQGQNFQLRTTRSAIISDTYAFSPKLLNELKFGYVRFTDPRHGPLLGADIVALAGLTGYPTALDPAAFGLPQVAISGLRGISSQAETRDTQNQYTFTDHVTWIHGSHSLKIGGDLRFNNDSQWPASPSLQFGTSSFNGFATGHPFADFLLGIPRTFTRSAAISPFYGSNRTWSLFFQDNWNVTRSLTLNLGIRYERFEPWREKNNRIHSFDLATGSVVVPNAEVLGQIHPLFPANIPIITASQAGLPERSLIRTDKNDFAPRVGFAWRTGIYDMVLRGGYGIFYDFVANKGFRRTTGGPFVAAETFDNTITGGQPAWSWPLVIPNAAARPLGTQDLFVISSDMSSAYMHQWNLTVERQFGDYGLRLSYIGNSGIQLPYTRNINQPPPSPIPFSQARRPYPLLRDIIYHENGASQQYNSFQTEVVRRFSRGFSITAHYTLAKNITNYSFNSVLGGKIDNAYDRAAEKGNDENTPRHRFLTYFIWDAPRLQEQHSLIRGVLGGWRFSGNFAANSGLFYTPFFTGRDISNTNITTGRPDRIADGNVGDARTLTREFDVSAFVVPPAGIGRFGNSGRGIIVGRGFWGMNLGIMKYFGVTETLKVRLQAGMKNVFNHPKFGIRFDPIMNISIPTAGHTIRTDIITLNDVTANRAIEVGVRVEW